LYYIVVISAFYIPLICSEKRPSCVEQINILFSFFVFLFLFYSFSYSRYISWCVSRLQEQHVVECLRSIIIYCKSFARPTEHFHSISRFALSDCYEIHRTKCACAPNVPPFVRLTRSFARRIRTTFTKPTFIWIGEVAFLHTRRHRHTRPFYARFLWYREHSHVSLHLQSHHCPEVQSHETIFILIYCSLA